MITDLDPAHRNISKESWKERNSTGYVLKLAQMVNLNIFLISWPSAASSIADELCDTTNESITSPRIVDLEEGMGGGWRWLIN